MSHPPGYRGGEAPASQQCSVSHGGSKVTSERVALLVLSILLAAAVIVICRLSLENLRTNNSFQTLRDEHEAFKRNLTAEKRCESSEPTEPQLCPRPKPNDSCPMCGEGWEQQGEKCYYFSSDKSNWEESRSQCRHQGGDLVKIESVQEQKFLAKRLADKMDNPGDKFWIGLTDSQEEKTWLWADNSPLDTSVTFWSGTEPDNWDGENKIDGEDCVMMGEKYSATLISWFDKDCRVPHRRICEEPAKCV